MKSKKSVLPLVNGIKTGVFSLSYTKHDYEVIKKFLDAGESDESILYTVFNILPERKTMMALAIINRVRSGETWKDVQKKAKQSNLTFKPVA